MDPEPKQKTPNRPPLTLALVNLTQAMSRSVRASGDAGIGEVLTDFLPVLDAVSKLRAKYLLPAEDEQEDGK